jgi:hypothetical protein
MHGIPEFRNSGEFRDEFRRIPGEFRDRIPGQSPQLPNVSEISFLSNPLLNDA